jgi:hypothetical protein
MNDKGQQFYEYLKSVNIDVPSSYGEFQSAMQDQNTASQFYDFVKSQDIDVPETSQEFQSVFSSSVEGEPVNFTNASDGAQEQSTSTFQQGSQPSEGDGTPFVTNTPEYLKSPETVKAEEQAKQTAWQDNPLEPVSRLDMEKAGFINTDYQKRLDEFSANAEQEIPKIDVQIANLQSQLGNDRTDAATLRKIKELAAKRSGYLLSRKADSENIEDYADVVNTYEELAPEDKKAFQPQVDAYQKKMEPIIQEAIDRQIPEYNYENMVVMDEAGEMVPDTKFADNYSKAVAKDLGIEDKKVTRLIAKRIEAMAEEVTFDKRVSEEMETYGKVPPELKEKLDDLKTFTLNPIVTQKEKQVQQVFETSLKSAAEINAEYNSKISEARGKVQMEITLANANGEIPDEKVRDVLTNRQDQVTKNLQDERQALLNRVNENYSKTVLELESSAIQQQLAEQLKFSKENNVDEVTAKFMNDNYRKAVKNVSGDIASNRRQSEDYNDNIFQTNYMNSLFNSLSGTAQSIGFEEYVPYFDQVAYLNTPAQREYGDGDGIGKFLASAANLAGSMTTQIPVQIAVSAATGGMGTIPQLLATGAVGWGMETATMTGNMYNQTLKEGGSITQARNNAQEMYDAQVSNMYLYTLDGLPFVGKALNRIGLSSKLATGATRVITGGAIETGTETAQEIVQGAQEQAISARGQYENYSDFITPDYAMKTFLEVAPTFLLGGGGQLMSMSRESKLGKRAAKEFTKEDVNDYIKASIGLSNAAPDVVKQSIYNTYLNEGFTFTAAMIEGLKSNGTITSERATELGGMLKDQMNMFSTTKSLGLTPIEGLTYYAISDKYRQLKEQADAIENDDIAKGVIMDRANKFKQSASEFLADPKNGGSYVTVTTPNRPDAFLSAAEFKSFVEQDGVAEMIEGGKITYQSRNVDGVDNVVNDQLEKVAQSKGKKADQPQQQAEPKKEEEKELTPEENLAKAMQDIDSYIGGLVSETEEEVFGGKKVVDSTLDKMNNAEYVNDDEIEESKMAIDDEITRINSMDISDNAKKNIIDNLEQIKQELDNYEFRTKTNVIKTPAKPSTKGDGKVTEAAPEATKTKSETTAEVGGRRGFTIRFLGGNKISLVFRNKPTHIKNKSVSSRTTTFTFPKDFLFMDEEGNFLKLILRDAEGNRIVIRDPEVGVPLALQNLRALTGPMKNETVSAVVEEQQATVTTEDVNYIKENKNAVQEQTTSEVPVQPEAQVGGKVDEKVQAEPQVTTQEGKEKVAPKTAKEKLKERSRKQTILKQIENAKKAIARVAKGVEIIVATTPEHFEILGGDKGAYVDGKIYIDLDKADFTTVAHEVFHGLLLHKGMSDAMARRLTENMLKTIRKTASQDLLARLDEFASMYVGEAAQFRSEESMAQLFGIIAESYAEMDGGAKSAVRQWLDGLIKALGLEGMFPKDMSPLTASDKEVLNFLNTVARKVATGEEVTDQDVAVLNGEVSGAIADTNAVRKSILGSFTLKRFPVNKNTSLQSNVSIEKFKGKTSNLLESDRMTGAYIEDAEGNPAFKFFGGLYFPVITGKWWASRTLSKASSIASTMNMNRDVDGYIYSTPIIMNPNSHMSNQDMFETVWEFMKHDLRSPKSNVTKKLFHEYVSSALKLKSINLTESDININKSDSVDTMISKLNEILLGDNVTLSFEKRKAFIQAILGDAKVKEDRKFPSAGSISEVAAKFEEEETKKAKKLWDVVMVMRTKGNLSTKVTDKSDEFYHKSYPAEISSNEPIEVFFLDGAYNITDIYPVLKKSNGDSFSWEEYSSRHKSAKLALSQYGRTAKLAKASGSITVNNLERKQRDAKWEQEAKDNLPDSNIKSKFLFEDKIKSGKWAMLTGENPNAKPATEEENKKFNEDAVKWLKKLDKNPIPIFGKYGGAENSFFVENLRSDDAAAFAREFKQESVATNEGLILPNGDRYPRLKGEEEFNSEEDDYYSVINIKGEKIPFKVGYDVENLETALPEKIKEKLTDDGKGNYVFYHYSSEKRDVLKPFAGDAARNFTSKEEASALSSVGGVVMFYTDPNTKEAGVGNVKHTITIPKDKVYYFQTDRAGLYLKAKELFNEARPNQAFSPNYQAAWISKIMDEAGYEILVSDWKEGKLRAQTTKEVIVDESARNKAREEKAKQTTRKQKPSIQEMIDFAKEEGISKKDLREFLKEEGYSDAAIKQALPRPQVRPPSARRITGQPKPKKVTVQEMAALKDQIRLEARAARGAVSFINKIRRDIQSAIEGLQKVGKLSTKQVNSITNKLNKVNLLNPIMRERFIDYMEKVYNNAEYAAKLSQARATRAKVKKKIKSEGTDAVLGSAAKVFAKVDPSMVDDIDAYNEVADKVLSGLSSSRVGGNFRSAFDIDGVLEYANKKIEEQDKAILNKLKETFEEITGTDPKDMTYAEMMSLLEVAEDDNALDAKNKQVRAVADAYFELYSKSVSSIISDKVDPFTGEDIEVDPYQAGLMKRLMSLDRNNFTTKELVQAVDILNNFVVNGKVGGVEKIVMGKEGLQSAQGLKGLTQRVFRFFAKKVGRIEMSGITSLPLLFERKFGGFSAGQKVMKAMGLQDLIKAASTVMKTVDVAIVNYYDKFGKTKPNGEEFNSVYNNAERGLYASLKRTVNGTAEEQAAEFKRMKNLWKESTEYHKNGTEKEKVIGEKMQKAYAKIAASSNSIAEVESKMDATNKKATEYWMDKFKGIKPSLDQVSLSMYNTVLEDDLFYTPITTKRKVGEDGIVDDNVGSFSALTGNSVVAPGKAGQLKQINRPATLSARYLSPDFDTNMANAYNAALMDISTAPYISKIKGFMNSKEGKALFGSQEDYKVIVKRVQDYINAKRGQKRFSTNKDFDRVIDLISKLGATRALGSITQPVKQTIPVAINAMIASNPANFLTASGLISGNKDAMKFLEESGYAIAIRGASARASIDSMDQQVSKLLSKTNGNVGKAMELVSGEWLLNNVLVKPDVFVAKVSWMSFYLQSLNKQGVKTGNIDWATHKINTEAAEYAQGMVDRSQNVSDSDLQGSYFTDPSTSMKFVRGMFPFMTFILNQKERMYSDIITISSLTSSKEDKEIAFRSLIGTLSEIASFSYISYYVSAATFSIAAAMIGYDEPEEEKKKRLANLWKGKVTTFTSDILSPFPPVSDYAIMATINAAANATYGEDVVYEPRDKSLPEQLGVFGITASKALDLKKLLDMAYDGKFMKESFGKETEKTLTQGQQDSAKLASALLMMHLLGAPSDLGNVSGYIRKTIERNSSSASSKAKSSKGSTKKKIKIPTFNRRRLSK